MSDDLIRKMVLEFIEIHDVCAWSLADIKRMESAMRAALLVLAREFEDGPSTTYFKLDGHMVSANKIAAAAIREVAE